MNFFKRMGPALLGGILLPVRTVYHCIEAAIAVIVVAGSIVVAAPVLSSILFHRENYPVAKNLIYTLCVIIPTSIVLVSSSIVAIGGYLVYTTVVDIVGYSQRGFKRGFTHGMNGLWDIYESQNSYIQLAIDRIDDFVRQLRRQELPNEPDSNPSPRFNRESFFRFQLDALDLQAPMSRKNTNRLGAAELNKAHKIVDAFSKRSVPLPPRTKDLLETVKTLINRYKALSSDLDTVRLVLSGQSNAGPIDDQLIACSEVKTPIFFSKQYLTSTNHWRSVPANGYISDKDALLRWFQNKPLHPLNRDSLIEPPRYQNQPTRYVWHLLTKDNCFVHELGESTHEIRELIDILDAELMKLTPRRITSSRARDAVFFSRRSAEERSMPRDQGPVFEL